MEKLEPSYIGDGNGKVQQQFGESLMVFKKLKHWGFPGGAVVENPPAGAGDTGSSPGLGGSHMPQSNWACEPWLLSLRVWSLCSEIGRASCRERV